MRLESTSGWKGLRVELFQLEPEDVTGRYVDWLNDPAVNRFLEVRWQRSTLHTTSEFVALQIESPASLLLGMRAIDTGQHVGNIKLGPIDIRHGLAEVGIMIGEAAARGTGIGSEAIRLLAGIARDQLALRKLTAGCYASNMGSTRAFQKAGFHVEGTRREHFLLDGKPENLTLLARLL
jgi:[ribosomal protein S5]-alanine N-acetyltransferase